MGRPFVRGRGQSAAALALTKGNCDGETRLPMVTRSLKWVCITALLLVVLLRSSASHQLSVDFLVCAGAFAIVLALILKTRGSDFLQFQ